MPQAGIVNYYQVGDSLTGRIKCIIIGNHLAYFIAHQDKSEPNPVPPLVSMSLGLDSIFLFGNISCYFVGGMDRDTPPIPLLLQSGDVVVMSGDARLCFHGYTYFRSSSLVRVIPDTCPTHLLNDDPVGTFMSHSRINVNVRQVF
jgi:alkylated DNA repair protein alkB family protein 1